MSEIIKPTQTDYLSETINANRQLKREIASVPELKIRLGNVVRKHIPFPEEVNRKNIERSTFIQNKDYVFPAAGKSRIRGPKRLFNSIFLSKELSKTELKCETKQEKEALEIVISYPIYPFEKWEGKAEDRSVVFTVRIKEFGCFIFNSGTTPKFEKENGECKNANLVQFKILQKTLDLIEDPAITEYTPAPYDLLKIPHK